MPGNLPTSSKSNRVSAPLPTRLLPGLLARGKVLLCLDYDGTIAEIVSDPASAWPLPGVGETLQALARIRERIRVAIVSGRDVATLTRLLGADSAGLILSGTHGLELSYYGVTRELVNAATACEPELAQVRGWLAANVPPNRGFFIEDKEIAIAVHYRSADAAAADVIRRKFEIFLMRQTPRLTARHGKMVIEAIPNIASKGHAVRELIQHVGESFTPVYFGDDLTDEDAFAAIGERGVTVLVGKERKSGARYRVDSPQVVADLLSEMAAALNVTPPATPATATPR